MNLKKLLMLATVPALALSLVACGGKKAAASSGTANQNTVIKAEDLVAEWRADPASAVQKYSQKQVTITGLYERSVGGPPKSPNYSILLQGRNPANLEFVQVILPDNQTAIIQKLKRNDRLTVTCTLKDNKFCPSCDNPKIELK